MKIAAIIVLFHTEPEDLRNLLREFAHIKQVTPIVVDQSGTKYGYAHGVNVGLRKAMKQKYDRMIILNPDISIAGISYATLIAGSSHFGIWGGVMKQHGIQYFGGVIDPKRMSGGLNRKKPKNRFTPVDFVTGSFMGIHRSVIETIGMWNELYGMYYEDVEYCFRAQKHDIKVGIDTRLLYTHFERTVHSIKKEWYLARNRIYFLLQYGTAEQKKYEFIRMPITIIEYIFKLLLFWIQYPV